MRDSLLSSFHFIPRKCKRKLKEGKELAHSCVSNLSQIKTPDLIALSRPSRKSNMVNGKVLTPVEASRNGTIDNWLTGLYASAGLNLWNTS
jgi:hypothetical protein